MTNLTDGQMRILKALDGGPLTTRSLVEATWTRLGVNTATRDSIHSAMRRLEDRELVRRIGGRPAKWELTGTGRKAIA